MDPALTFAGRQRGERGSNPVDVCRVSMVKRGMDEREADAAKPPPRRRGPRRYGFSYADMARVAGLAPETVRRKATGKRREFRPADLESLVTWLAARIWQRRAQESR